MIYTRRGTKPLIVKKKIDVILTAVKLGPGGKLDFARSYIRRGPVWGDRVVMKREELLERLNGGQNVFTGVEADAVGDFEVWKKVIAIGEQLALEGVEGSDDRLGLPLL